MNNFYDLYNFFEKDQIDISTMRYMIENNLSLKDIEAVVNLKVYERLIDKKTLNFRSLYVELFARLMMKMK